VGNFAGGTVITDNFIVEDRGEKRSAGVKNLASVLEAGTEKTTPHWGLNVISEERVVGYPRRRKGPKNTGNGGEKDTGTAAVFKPP
jgi:hypothetical protein